MDKIRIGITIGDPSGIGPEVVMKSLRIFKIPGDCEIFVIGDQVALKKNGLKNNAKFNLIDLKQIKQKDFQYGYVSKKFGLASLNYLKAAVGFINKGIIDCLVTAPVNKQSINLNKIYFVGHTEFLAKHFNVKDFVMMFISKNLKVSLVTRHIPLNLVAKSIRRQDVYNTLSLTYKALKKCFMINHPKIAISGLNPHASENGLIGDQENKIIIPAIKQFVNDNKLSNSIFGPIPADAVFHRALRKEFDAVICMYHDQGLIPFKMLHFFDGVNLTIGLPFIRTSPDHGTAFEIAGKNKADFHSMLEAIKLAYRLTKNKLADK